MTINQFFLVMNTLRDLPHLSINKFNFILIPTLLLSFATISLGQSDGSLDKNGLVNPELFEQFMPEQITPDFKKSGFSARSSPSENWGGASYMGNGTFLQVGIRHFSPTKWKQEKADSQNDGKPIKVGKNTGYLDETMGQQELIVYFGHNFSARAIGADITKEDLVTMLKKLPYKKINALASSSNSNPKKENSEPNTESLRALLPDHLTGMSRGEIQASSNEPAIAVSYRHRRLPYFISVRLAKGNVTKKAKYYLEKELEERNTDLQEVRHNGSVLWFRKEESTISFTTFKDELYLTLIATAPANTSFNKQDARNHLLQAFAQLKRNM